MTAKLSDVPHLHVCWPWEETCGYTLRLQIRLHRWTMHLALRPSSKFVRRNLQGRLESYWFDHGKMSKEDWPS